MYYVTKTTQFPLHCMHGPCMAALHALTIMVLGPENMCALSEMSENHAVVVTNYDAGKFVVSTTSLHAVPCMSTDVLFR